MIFFTSSLIKSGSVLLPSRGSTSHFQFCWMGICRVLMMVFFSCTWLLLDVCQLTYRSSTKGVIGFGGGEPQIKPQIKSSVNTGRQRRAVAALVRHLVRNEQMLNQHYESDLKWEVVRYRIRSLALSKKKERSWIQLVVEDLVHYLDLVCVVKGTKTFWMTALLLTSGGTASWTRHLTSAVSKYQHRMRNKPKKWALGRILG